MSPRSHSNMGRGKTGRVSLATVAEKSGVSTATASRIINGINNKASKETVQRVKAVVESLGYRPASSGRTLRTQESRIVGLLAASIANPMIAAFASSIEWALRAEGYVMALCDTHEMAEVQDEYLLEMQSQLARAIIIIGAVKSPVLDQMQTSGPPILFVNRPDPNSTKSPYVGMDNYQAGLDMARCLIAQGVRKFGVIHGSLNQTAATFRHSGFMAGLSQAGVDSANVTQLTGEGTNPLEVGYACMPSFIDMQDGPDVIVCTNDILAYGAYRRVIEAGLDPTRDFAFFGFDDNPLNQWIAPWLNSVGIEEVDIGSTCLSILKQIWAGNEVEEPAFLPHRIRLNGSGLP
ncbi:LacI family DNA-binding transcriptional regulator [uncultured Cohaesibacter sp.]|uniref:LacI family DNA-binding transcriptional regulator n=1 Tax=uncultured Cohaesibacter sp. TaxID=1002546 RepID=UPI0029C6BEFD|nr:LacI family DNA-binding transcriptional regulator [uncultured Cohaesibacter sp.]